MTRFHLVSVSSSIVEDIYEEGEGKETGCGLNEQIGKTFDSLNKLEEYLKSYYDLEDLEKEGMTFVTSVGRANHSEKQNGGWMVPTPDEIEQWKQKKVTLYLEHYSFGYLEVL